MKCEHFVDMEKCKLCNENLDEINEQIKKGMMKRTDFKEWMRVLGNPEENVPILEEQIKKKKFNWVIPKNWKADNQTQS